MTARESKGRQQVGGKSRTDREVVPKDLQQPLRLRFVNADRDSSEAISSENWSQVRASSAETSIVDLDEILAEQREQEDSAHQLNSGTLRTSLRSHCRIFGYGVTAAIVFWLYVLPELRPDPGFAKPGMFESGESGTEAAIANNASDRLSRWSVKGNDSPLSSDARRSQETTTAQATAKHLVLTSHLVERGHAAASTTTDGRVLRRSPQVFAMADNPMHVQGVEPKQDPTEVGSGVLATQLGSLNPAVRLQAAEMLLERGWEAEHLELARQFLRAPLSMQKEMVESLTHRGDINVVPWFLWMLEVAEPDLAGLLVSRLEASVSPRDASAIRAASMSENQRFRAQLQTLADQLDQLSY